MSRIGRQPIALPKGVTVSVGTGIVTVKGAKGELKVAVSPEIGIQEEGGNINVTRPSDSRTHRALHGLTRTLLANAIQGVSQGFQKNLELHGVGFRAKLSGKALELSIGYSHPVIIEPPAGISFVVPEQTKIQVHGIDKQLVGQVTANVREKRIPDAYHGKGVRFEGEKLSLKPGKSAAGGKGGKK
ncbi:MAG: 50S ribosomal protein L6 [Deinococcales bacterium]